MFFITIRSWYVLSLSYRGCCHSILSVMALILVRWTVLVFFLSYFYLFLIIFFVVTPAQNSGNKKHLNRKIILLYPILYLWPLHDVWKWTYSIHLLEKLEVRGRACLIAVMHDSMLKLLSPASPCNRKWCFKRCGQSYAVIVENMVFKSKMIRLRYLKGATKSTDSGLRMKELK